MAQYRLTLQENKDPKDKTGIEIFLKSPTDDDAIAHANERLTGLGVKQGKGFHIHLKQCGGRTVYYSRGY